MRLYISGKKAWNSTFSAENGDAIYVAQSPKKIFGRTTTIKRVVPSYAYTWGSKETYGTSDNVAQFAWKTFRSARLRIRNKEVKTRSFFRKKGWHVHGRWMLGTGIPELRLNNDSRTLVARYHPKGQQEFFTAKVSKPFLEIMSGWKGITDEIVVSFVYIEKLVEDD
ncbi:hypothetical protein H0H87_012369 [Tephrocybe sp. NHM501043]|nr:hypothetical protein H0H87_012369 [Tephrocybe sp. NHM501043]